jgi:hypothetical protein
MRIEDIGETNRNPPRSENPVAGVARTSRLSYVHTDEKECYSQWLQLGLLFESPSFLGKGIDYIREIV